MTNVYRLKVDLKLKHTSIVPTFVQYDTAKLEFQIFDNGKIFNLDNFSVVEFAHRKANGTVILSPGQIETDDKGHKIVSYVYEGREMSELGVVDTTFTIVDNNQNKISIQTFKVRIVSNLREFDDPNSPAYKKIQEYAVQVEEVKVKGDYAKEQGDYAKQVADANKTNFLAPVAVFADLAKTYPAAKQGDTARVTSESAMYRFQTGSGWIKTDQYNPVVVDELNKQLADSVVTGKRVGSTLASNQKDIKLSYYQSSKLVLSEGSLINVFGDISKFTTLTGGTMSNNSFTKKNNNSLKLVGNVSGQFSNIRGPINISVAESDNLGIWFYVEDCDAVDYISFRFANATTGDMTNRFELIIYTHNMTDGWNFFKFMKEDCTVTGSPTWDNLRWMEMRILGVVAKQPIIYFDSFIKNCRMKPVVLIHFDDSQLGMYLNAYPYMKARNMKGTNFVSNRSLRYNYLGHTKPNFMDMQQHEDLYTNGGWDHALHSKTHNDVIDLRTNTNYNDQYYDLNFNKEFLAGHGFLRGNLYFSAPNGRHNKITEQVMRGLGVKIFRTSKNGFIDYYDTDTFFIKTKEIQNTTTFATIKSEIDKAIRLGSVMPIFTHDVAVGNTDQFSMEFDLFKQMVDYLTQKRDNGELSVLSFDELYNQSFEQTVRLPEVLLQKNLTIQPKIAFGNTKPTAQTSGDIYIRRMK